jgi:CheY-like chemotaxis protein
MPRMDGIEMLAELRADEDMRALPVIIMSSSKEDPDLRRCYSLGINAYVVKPVDFDQFSRTVTQMGVFWALINEPPPVL